LKHIGFPAYMKPFPVGGWEKNVCMKLNNSQEFFKSHSENRGHTYFMMFCQEEIVFNEYFPLCYCLGGNE